VTNLTPEEKTLVLGAISAQIQHYRYKALRLSDPDRRNHYEQIVKGLGTASIKIGGSK
jgi:hypothetical protein